MNKLTFKVTGYSTFDSADEASLFFQQLAEICETVTLDITETYTNDGRTRLIKSVDLQITRKGEPK